MLRSFALSLTVLASACAWSGTACPQHFATGSPPAIVNPKLLPRTQEVCFEAFVVLHSGVSRTPLYAAEHLVRANLVLAKKLSREDSFHAETALPPQDRAELKDYVRSGYDRGHMAPNADFANRTAQAESFSLANMVPQVHANNAGVWADLEAAARTLAMNEGEVYVVSGPAFVGSDIQKIGGRVLVPTHLWKVVYSPRKQRAGAYLITNDETRDYTAMSVSQLQKFAGINPLPGLPQPVLDGGLELPKVQAQGGNRTREPSAAVPSINPTPQDDGFNLRDYARAILEAIERLGKK
jgi:endonuclease G